MADDMTEFQRLILDRFDAVERRFDTLERRFDAMITNLKEMSRQRERQLPILEEEVLGVHPLDEWYDCPRLPDVLEPQICFAPDPEPEIRPINISIQALCIF